MREKDREEVEEIIRREINEHAESSIVHRDSTFVVLTIFIFLIAILVSIVFYFIFIEPHLPTTLHSIIKDDCTLLQESLNATSNSQSLGGTCYICWQNCTNFDGNKTACDTNQKDNCKYYKVN